MKRGLLFFLILSLVLAGCTKPVDRTYHIPLVTQISIQRQGLLGISQRVTSDQEQMGHVLTYLRLTHTQFPAKLDPQTLSSDQYTIQLTLSDGSIQLYHQIGDTCFRSGEGPWLQLRPSHGGMLPLLFDSLPE